MDHQLHQSRNLSVHQTLDEILGISSKSDHSSTSSNGNGSGTEKNSLHSPMRPPTRHGRESAGSNEENKDPINIENGNGSSQTTASSLFSSSLHSEAVGNTRRHSEDEFFKKLNDIRRRSLISTMDTPAPSTTSISIHPDSPKREPRQRLTIHVEEAEPTVPLETSDLSRSSLDTSEDPQSLTFRVDEEKREETPKAVPRLSLKGKEEEKKMKLPPKMPNRPQTSGGGKKEQDVMMQRSMFNSANTKPSDAHHKEWLAKKEKEIRNKKQKEKEEEERKAQNEKERRENSAKLYERWVKDHDEKMKRLKEIRGSKEKEKREKMKLEKEEKKKEAEKNFQMWRQERSKSATDLRKKLEEEAEQKRKAEQLDREEKQKEAHAAFLAWKRKKEEFLSEEAQKLRREAKESKQREEEYSKDFRLMCATEAYETWMEMKDKEREMLADLVLIEAPPIPWIPPSNLVPRRFVKSSSGNRSKPRSQSAKSVTKRSRSRPSTTKSLRPFR